MFRDKAISFLRVYFGSILIALAIGYVSLIPAPSVSLPAFPHADKVAHLIMYFVLAAVMAGEMMQRRLKAADSIGYKPFGIVLLIGAIYGGVIELLQEYFFPPRTGDWWDWLADCTGALLAVILFRLYYAIRHE